MRRTKGASPPSLWMKSLVADRQDGGRFQRFVVFHLRQDAGQAARQHGLSGAGWADHQQAVAAGRCYFQGAFGMWLTAHFGQIIPFIVPRSNSYRRMRHQQLAAVEMRALFEQVMRRQHIYSPH